MASLLDTLTKAVSKGEVKSRVKRSAQWFRDKLTGLEGEARNRFSSTNPDKFYRESPNCALLLRPAGAILFGDSR